MSDLAENMRGGRASPWRVALGGAAASLLLLPAVAMQFTAEVNWDEADFLFAAVLIGGLALLLDLAMRKSPNGFYRAGIGAALAVAFLTIWSNAAVGMIGSEDDPLNLMFAGVVGIALLGAILARFRSQGMARTTALAAAAQLIASGIGFFVDARGGIFSAMFAGLWLLSAFLFREAGRGVRG
jgi:hypothetical protein